MQSDLQALVNGRLGKAGPWHRLVEQYRAEGDSWNLAAIKLGQAARLPLGRVTGNTVRRWVGDRQAEGQVDSDRAVAQQRADELQAAKAVERLIEHADRRRK